MTTLSAPKTKTNARTKTTTRLVHFEVTAPDAKSVCIAGPFNDWHPSVSPLIPLGNGHWVKRLTLAPGVYEYRFVVDGEWLPDPQAGDVIADPFGGWNSVVTVCAPTSPKSSSRDRELSAASP